MNSPGSSLVPRTPGATQVRRVPVRSLSQRHRARIVAHLLALPPRDRYLRFGHLASDLQVSRYVDGIDFACDEVFGIFNRRLELVAMAHLAYLGATPGQQGAATAEFGVSVDQRARGRGWGARLFERAVLHARNRHVDTLIIHALSENSAMLHIARNAGAGVLHEGPDSLARLKLPPETFGSHLEALLDNQVAELDYRFKQQAHRFDAWLQRLHAGPASAEPGAAPRLHAPPGVSSSAQSRDPAGAPRA